ncbi:MAG: methylmalonyl Co-A mutase-associated GTPase MeaB [Chloroflexota bacterium]|nr:methylmalonyl Co-A mutase-associated GTPase MeaB [Chloroflexota bacterium]
MDVAAAALAGDRRALARLLSWVENGTVAGRKALVQLFPQTGEAHVIGITGAPGAGKSTLVNQLAREIRERGQKLAIVAVDPTSPYSGGALLGDRLRMRALSTDTGVFMRSMASRGDAGGIAHATRDVVSVLDAVGYPLILVETVGAGQSQVEVARMAHTVVLVEAPGMGDDIQALKAGLMEIADIIVVNKADKPEARQTVRALQSVRPGMRSEGHPRVSLGEEAQVAVEVAGWEAPILQTSALENRGVEELLAALEAHRDFLKESGQWRARLQENARAEVESWLQRQLLALLADKVGEARLTAVVDTVRRRENDPASAAQELLAAVLAAAGGKR